MSDNLLLLVKMKGVDIQGIQLGNFNYYTNEFVYQHIRDIIDVIAWKEIVLPEPSKVKL